MKNFIIVFALVFSALILGCKKKNAEPDPEAPAPVVNTPKDYYTVYYSATIPASAYGTVNISMQFHAVNDTGGIIKSFNKGRVVSPGGKLDTTFTIPRGKAYIYPTVCYNKSWTGSLYSNNSLLIDTSVYQTLKRVSVFVGCGASAQTFTLK